MSSFEKTVPFWLNSLPTLQSLKISLLVSKDLTTLIREHSYLFSHLVLDANKKTRHRFQSLLRAAFSLANGTLKELTFVGKFERGQPKLTRDDLLLENYDTDSNSFSLFNTGGLCSLTEEDLIFLKSINIQVQNGFICCECEEISQDQCCMVLCEISSPPSPSLPICTDCCDAHCCDRCSSFYCDDCCDGQQKDGTTIHCCEGCNLMTCGFCLAADASMSSTCCDDNGCGSHWCNDCYAEHVIMCGCCMQPICLEMNEKVDCTTCELSVCVDCISEHFLKRDCSCDEHICPYSSNWMKCSECDWLGHTRDGCCW